MMIACGVFFFICSLNNCQMKSMAMAEDDDSMWRVLLYLCLNNCQMKPMAMAEDDDSMWRVLLYL